MNAPRTTTDARLASEADFFNREYGGRLTVGRLEQWVASLFPPPTHMTERLLNALGPIDGQRVCEFGCGTGRLTNTLATEGARVHAIDVSEEAVRLARERNAAFVPDRVEVSLLDAGALPFEDGSFDAVVGIDALHHLDRDRAAREIRRILRPGGRAVFVEPLGHNPVSDLWRKLTPGIRSPHERPMTYDQIARMGAVIGSSAGTEFDLLTLFSPAVFLVTRSAALRDRASRRLSQWDRRVLAVCKPLRRFCGMVLIRFDRATPDAS